MESGSWPGPVAVGGWNVSNILPASGLGAELFKGVGAAANASPFKGNDCFLGL